MAGLRVVLIAAIYGLQIALGQEQPPQPQYGAVSFWPEGLVPRFIDDEPQLARRQGNPCGEGQHRCIDIEQPGSCCGNDRYCYVRRDGSPACCPIGRSCESNCETTQYQCIRSTTLSASASASASTFTSSRCCNRQCRSTSQFRCESEFGGGCCSYGATCALSNGGGVCRRTITSTPSAIVTPIDEGCTAASQRACRDEGSGCCDATMHCTEIDGVRGCAPGNTENGVTLVPDPDADDDDDGGGGGGGLSTGATAGIAAGVTIGGSAIIGALIWLCIKKRRKQRQLSEGGQGQGQQLAERNPQSGYRSGGRRSTQPPSGTASRRPRGQTLASERSGGQAVSEVATDITRTTRQRGLTQDYFGPDATAGPYTDGSFSPASSSPGHFRGVPLMAHSPNDIAAPVEIDSRVSGGLAKSGGADATVTPAPPSPQPSPGIENRFELAGSEVVSPRSPNPEQSQHQHQYQQHSRDLSPGQISPRSMESDSEYQFPRRQ